MKIYVFIAALVAIFVLFVYVAGVHDGVRQCNTHATENIIQQQNDLIKLQENINVETIHVATADVRRVLREKYTIAQ